MGGILGGEVTKSTNGRTHTVANERSACLRAAQKNEMKIKTKVAAEYSSNKYTNIQEIIRET